MIRKENTKSVSTRLIIVVALLCYLRFAKAFQWKNVSKLLLTRNSEERRKKNNFINMKEVHERNMH